MVRTSIRKNVNGMGFIVTNFKGQKFHVFSKSRANEIANASKRVVIKRAIRRRKK